MKTKTAKTKLPAGTSVHHCDALVHLLASLQEASEISAWLADVDRMRCECGENPKHLCSVCSVREAATNFPYLLDLLHSQIAPVVNANIAAGGRCLAESRRQTYRHTEDDLP